MLSSPALNQAWLPLLPATDCSPCHAMGIAINALYHSRMLTTNHPTTIQVRSVFKISNMFSFKTLNVKSSWHFKFYQIKVLSKYLLILKTSKSEKSIKLWYLMNHWFESFIWLKLQSILYYYLNAFYVDLSAILTWLIVFRESPGVILFAVGNITLYIVGSRK